MDFYSLTGRRSNQHSQKGETKKKKGEKAEDKEKRKGEEAMYKEKKES